MLRELIGLAPEFRGLPLKLSIDLQLEQSGLRCFLASYRCLQRLRRQLRKLPTPILLGC